MNLFAITFEQVLVLFILIFLGYLCFRTGILNAARKEELSGVLVNLVIPAVILNSFQRMDKSQSGVLLRAFLLCGLVHLLLIGLSRVFLPERAGGNHRIERICTTYTNAGFMGIPLLTALFGAEGGFYAAVYVAVFHLFLWTIGVFSLSDQRDFRAALRQLVTPTLLAALCSVLLFLSGLQLPELLLKPVGYLSDMNTPLAMLVTGVSLGTCDFAAMFRKKRLYYVGALRLFLFPALLALLFRVCSFRDTAALCILTAAACPTAALVPMIALRYGHDEETASGVFAMTTLFSVVSIPCFTLLIS